MRPSGPTAPPFIASLVLASLVLAGGVGCSGGGPGAAAAGDAHTPSGVPEIRSKVVDLAPLQIDGIYHSMTGPNQRVDLDTTGIGWLTGFRTLVIDSETEEPMGDEYFCHSQLQLATSARLMVCATGIDEIRLPTGYGMPLKEILEAMEEPWNQVSLLGMVLNNHEADADEEVKLRFIIDYVADDDPGAASLKRLYKATVPLIPDAEQVEGAWYRSRAVIWRGDPPQPTDDTVETPHGKEGHWYVPPGQQIVRQRYRNLIGVPTRVHYGVVHLHNHAVSMSLTDATTGELLWKTDVAYEPDRRQIASIPVYSSEQGFQMHPDREYEIETVYENRSDEPFDAMAVMYLYHSPINGERVTYPAPQQAAQAQQQHPH